MVLLRSHFIGFAPLPYQYLIAFCSAGCGHVRYRWGAEGVGVDVGRSAGIHDHHRGPLTREWIQNLTVVRRGALLQMQAHLTAPVVRYSSRDT